MVRFEDLIGQRLLMFPKKAFRPQETGPTLYPVTLRGVEPGGIWIENEAVTEMVAAALRPVRDISDMQTKPVCFFPFSEIQFLTAFSLPLDEASLGV
jgi:hypothetical protein